MVEIRTSACGAISLTGDSASGSQKHNQVDNIALKPIVQVWGNRCRHNPLTPHYFNPPENQKRPPAIQEVIHWFQGSYFEPKLYGLLYNHLESGRIIRSEFREMISMGCAILTYYYDVMSGELGFRNESGKWVRMSYQQLANKLKVSLQRVKRFFHFLKKHQLVEIVPDRKKQSDGSWRSNVSRKFLKPCFFIQTLGVQAWRKIVRFKEWLEKKSKPRTKKEQENVGMVKRLLGSSMNGMSKVLSSVVKRPSVPYANPDKEKQIIQRAKAMFDRDPSKSWMEYYKQLKQNPV